MLAKLIFGQLRLKPLNTGLHIALIALGTAALLLVAHVLHAVSSHATRDARNIDLVIGAKGSPLQLVLAGVYHLDVAPGNIPLDEVEALAKNTLVKSVIPLSLGDSFAGARIVGTTPDFLTHYDAKFAQGKVWDAPMQAVLGADIAMRTGMSVGGDFVGAHGLDASGAGHTEQPFRVVGVLARTGTVLDGLIVTSLGSIWAMHHAPAPEKTAIEENLRQRMAHEKKVHDHDNDHSSASAMPNSTAHAPGGTRNEHDARESEPETTLALLTYASPLAAATLPRAINASSRLQAASPALESARMLTIFGWIADLLRFFSLLVLAGAALSMFAAMMQALADRRADLAVMRAFGAKRGTLTKLLLAESVLIGLAGAILGAIIARVAVWVLAKQLPLNVPLSASALALGEMGIMAAVVAFSAVVALWPAWRAYGLDAAAMLAQRQ